MLIVEVAVGWEAGLVGRQQSRRLRRTRWLLEIRKGKEIGQQQTVELNKRSRGEAARMRKRGPKDGVREKK